MTRNYDGFGTESIKPEDISPDNKVHWANMGPIWVLSAPDGSHVGPMNLSIRVSLMVMGMPHGISTWCSFGHAVGKCRHILRDINNYCVDLTCLKCKGHSFVLDNTFDRYHNMSFGVNCRPVFQDPTVIIKLIDHIAPMGFVKGVKFHSFVLLSQWVFWWKNTFHATFGIIHHSF